MNLQNDWEKLNNNRLQYTKLPWDTSLQSTIKNFLSKCEDFFDKGQNILPTKEERIRTILRYLVKDSSLEPTPPILIEERMIKIWKESWEYFCTIAHHSSDSESFITNLINFEMILRDLLEPRVFENMEEILRIIKEGENCAN